MTVTLVALDGTDWGRADLPDDIDPGELLLVGLRVFQRESAWRYRQVAARTVYARLIA